MILGLDTSVVLRLLIGEPHEQAHAAREALEQVASKRGSALISDLMVGETYFALRHHYHVPHAKAVRALRTLLDDRRVRSTGVSRTVLQAAEEDGAAPGLMDRLIHGDYERSGAALATFDRTAARLSGARLLVV